MHLPPRIVEVAPQVWVAQGYDFADIAFVSTSNGTYFGAPFVHEGSVEGLFDTLGRRGHGERVAP